MSKFFDGLGKAAKYSGKSLGAALKASGKGIAKASKATGKGLVKAYPYVEAGAKAVGKGARAAGRESKYLYNTAGEVSRKHRERVRAKEEFKTFKLEQRVARHALKQQLPQKRSQRIGNVSKPRGGPLSDSGFKPKNISKGRGGPLSDYKPKKPLMDSDKAAKDFINGKGGI